MTLIYETENFTVNSFEKPHISREEGGHIVIIPKIRVKDRTELSTELANEVMMLTQVVGSAMKKVMNEHGVDVGRINYQENGNWSVFKPEGPYMHIHIYGRAKSAKKQPYGAAVHLPFRDVEPEVYKDNNPLTMDDINAIRKELEINIK